MRRISSLALVIAVCGCQSAGPIPGTTMPLRATRSSGTMIETGYGSGYQIRRNGHYVFVTATHVIDGLKPQLPVPYSEIRYVGDRASLKLGSRIDEVAVLTVGPKPSVGDTLYAIGYAMPGNRLTVVKGICTAPGHMSGCVQNGMSGGPVLDSRGRVVGSVSSWMPDVGVTIFEQED